MFKKKCTSYLALLGALLTFVFTPLQASQTLSYSAVADQFHLMDQVSLSALDFFLIPDYRSSWIKTFELNERDAQYLDTYQQIRKKYQILDLLSPVLENKKNGLFAPHPDDLGDVIADSFYISETIEEALLRVSVHISPDELLFLSEFFQHFSDKITETLKWNPPYLENLIAYFNEQLEQGVTIDHTEHLARFYKSEKRPLKSVRVLFGQEGSFHGRCYGDHLLLIVPPNNLPLENYELMSYLTSIIIHEETHHISSMASYTQKQTLSKHFIEKVERVQDHPLNLLEEPLVIASQMLFIKHAYPEIYAESALWIGYPLASKYLSVLELYWDQERSIDIDFIDKCACLYRELICNKE